MSIDELVVGLDPSGPSQLPGVAFARVAPPGGRAAYGAAPEASLVPWTAVNVDVDRSAFVEALRSLGESLSQMQASARRAAEPFRELVRQMEAQEFMTEDDLRLAFGFEAPSRRARRSPLGAPEDPHGWTTPLRTEMHWTPPETGIEEVPRWLA